MNATTKTNDKPAVPRRALIQMALGGVAGGIFGYFAAKAVLFGDVPALADAHFGAFVITGVLILMGLFTVLTGFNDRMLRSAFMLDPDEQDLTFERRAAKRQGSVLIIAGLVMAIPALGPAAMPVPPAAAIALLLALLILETWLNWAVYRESDEFARRILAEVSVLTFWVFQMGLFVWASLEVFGFAPAVSALDLLVALMGVYLVAISVVTVRRGLVR